MTDSLSTYLATEIVEYLANATQFDTPPSTLYVSVEDDTDTDLSGSLSNAPVGVGSANWTISGTTFENDTNINLGEATTDLTNVETVAIYDGSDIGGTANLLLETPLQGGPYDVSDGTNITFETGDITYDAIEETV